MVKHFVQCQAFA